MSVQNLYKELQAYGESDVYPYHMPGHKRKVLGSVSADILNMDITEIDGFDNLHQAEGILKELQEKASALYGAEETFYLVNGSTCGILCAIHATVPEGGHILMARGSHKSAYHAVYLRGANISYLNEQTVSGFAYNEAVSAAQVEAALRENSHIDAVFIVSPTYEGRVADVQAIADIVHGYGIPLIVDEAHGAHLGFDKRFAPGSCMAGADLVIHSVHKTLPAMTQTALLHVNGQRINRAKLKRYIHIFQSSSPSYVLMASIADSMEIVEHQGEARFSFFWERYREMSEKLQKCRNLRFCPWKEIENKRQDIGKLVITAATGGSLGQWIYDTLRERYHLQCEMAAGDYCLAMFTLADDEEAYERMEAALREIDGMLDVFPTGGDRRESVLHGSKKCENFTGEKRDIAMEEYYGKVLLGRGGPIPFAKAWDYPCETVKMTEMVGRPVAEFINLYPPGIPLLVPGEILTETLYEKIANDIRRGLPVQGLERNV